MGTRAPGQDAGGRERGAREHAVSRQARPGAGATGPAPRTPPFLRQIRVNRVQLPRELRGHAPCSFERASRPGSPHRPYASQSAVAASRPLRHRAAHPPLRISPRVRARIRAQNCRRPAVAPRRDRRHHRAPAAACRAADVARTPPPPPRAPPFFTCLLLHKLPPTAQLPSRRASRNVFFFFSFFWRQKSDTQGGCVCCVSGEAGNGDGPRRCRKQDAATLAQAAALLRPATTPRHAPACPPAGHLGKRNDERAQHL